MFDTLANRLERHDGKSFPHAGLFDSFHSIGDNCELGLVQAFHGSRQLGLLKFSTIPFEGLLRAFDERFKAFSEANLGVTLVEASNGVREYFALEKTYGLVTHTALYPPTSEADAIAESRQRLAFLARLLVEDLQDAKKIFVFKTKDPFPPSKIAILYSLMRAYGPITLLWVRAAEGKKPAGHMEWLDDGLLCGRLELSADPNNYNARVWRKLCTAALVLHQSRAAVGQIHS